MVEIFKKRRDLLLALLKEVPGLKSNIPQGAFYVFPDVSYYFGKSSGGRGIATSTDLCMYLLDTAYVALVSGEGFGEPDYIRISYACEEEQIKMAVSRIKSALEKLK